MDLKKIFSRHAEALKFMLRAFRYRNYRFFFIGQSISSVGTWMQWIAISWLVYRLTKSPFLLGLVGFTTQMPTFLLASVAGVLADRLNRRRILVYTQSFGMVQAFILAALTISGAIEFWHILVLSFFSGLINAFDVPVRQTFLVDMVDKKEDLGNAIALSSLMFNAARLIGPSIAGIIISVSGEGACFVLNGVSYFAIIFALLAIDSVSRGNHSGNTDILEGIKEGFRYVLNTPVLKYVLLMVSLLSLLGMSYVVLLPIFAKELLGGGPSTLGFLMGAAGLGALAGGVMLASRQEETGLDSFITAAVFIFGSGLVAFSLSRVLWVSLLLMLLCGFGMVVQLLSGNTLLQNLTDDDKRGRVMSFYTMAFMGMSPLGSILAGWLASRYGAANTLFASGTVCTVFSFFLARRISLSMRRQRGHR